MRSPNEWSRLARVSRSMRSESLTSSCLQSSALSVTSRSPTGPGSWRVPSQRMVVSTKRLPSSTAARARRGRSEPCCLPSGWTTRRELVAQSLPLLVRARAHGVSQNARRLINSWVPGNAGLRTFWWTGSVGEGRGRSAAGGTGPVPADGDQGLAIRPPPPRLASATVARLGVVGIGEGCGKVAASVQQAPYIDLAFPLQVKDDVR